MKKQTLLAVLSVSTLSGAIFGTLLGNQAMAQSQDPLPHYTYVGLGVEDNDDYRGADTGIRIDGSYELQNRYFLSGYYRNFDVDAFDRSDSLSSFAAQFGRYFTLDHGFRIDVSGRVGHVDYGNGDTNLWGVSSNIRKRLGGMFEVHGGLAWVDYTSGGSDLQRNVGGRAYITPDFAVGIDLSDSEFGDTWMVTARYNF